MTKIIRMDSARSSLTWLDWQCLLESAEHGSEVAQHGKLFGDQQCLQGIAAIESQLLAWGVITDTRVCWD